MVKKKGDKDKKDWWKKKEKLPDDIYDLTNKAIYQGLDELSEGNEDGVKKFAAGLDSTSTIAQRLTSLLGEPAPDTGAT